MENNKSQLDDKNSIENFKFIYGEACKSHEQQQRDIEHLNNKFNWIIAINIAALFFILNSNKFNDNFLLALTFFSISLVFSVMSLWARTYKRGPKLAEMVEKLDWSVEKMIKNTNKALIKNIDSNYLSVKELKFFLKLSIIFNIIGILILIINYLKIC
jgi:hypothetical protein